MSALSLRLGNFTPTTMFLAGLLAVVLAASPRVRGFLTLCCAGCGFAMMAISCLSSHLLTRLARTYANQLVTAHLAEDAMGTGKTISVDELECGSVTLRILWHFILSRCFFGELGAATPFSLIISRIRITLRARSIDPSDGGVVSGH